MSQRRNRIARSLGVMMALVAALSVSPHATASVPILVSSGEEFASSGAWGIRLDGTFQHLLPRLDRSVVTPTWDAQRRGLFFTSQPFPRVPSEIYHAALGSRQAWRVTHNELFEDEIEAAPGGGRLVCTAWRAGSARPNEIYTVAIRSGSFRRLTHDRVSDQSPSWSPDGTQIVWVRDRQLWVMGGSGQRAHLLGDGIHGGSPSWSPDGRWILFVGRRGIARVRPDGSGLRLLIGHSDVWGQGLSHPLWAPSGDHISFLATRYSLVEEWWNGRLFVAPSDGQRPPTDITPEPESGILWVPHDW